jgi:hypothetical protein
MAPSASFSLESTAGSTNNTLRNIATSHANTITMKNHIRSDGTSSDRHLYRAYLILIIVDPHGMLLNITQIPVSSLVGNGRSKAILTTVHGRVVKHGAYMVSRIVSRQFFFPLGLKSIRMM